LQQIKNKENDWCEKHLDANFYSQVAMFLQHCAARDWFEEQVENPELMLQRGGKKGEPLPKELGLFDAKGMPLEQQSRESWLALTDWVNDEEAILQSAFPDGLSEADRTLLLDDLAILKQQPWSLQNAVATVLVDWSEDQPTKDISTEHYAEALFVQCKRVLGE
jgi:hypothetical protein